MTWASAARRAATRARHPSNGDTFPDDLAKLMAYFRPGGPGNGAHAVPGEGLNVPIWLLGSSDFSARLAAAWAALVEDGGESSHPG